jgi:hypothetical protein
MTGYKTFEVRPWHAPQAVVLGSHLLSGLPLQMQRSSKSRNASALAIGASGVAAIVIAVAATAAEFTPFPYIHQLSSLESSILNSIQVEFPTGHIHQLGAC